MGSEEVCFDGEWAVDVAQLCNDTVQTFSWHLLSVNIFDKSIGADKAILTNVSGCVKAGELLALMGPSGCGKTTLLDILAHRRAPANFKSEGQILINGCKPSQLEFRKLTSYVEQEDSLIGSLTSKETLNFAARLALPSTVSKTERLHRVDTLLASFGLLKQANTIIGTPIRKGISGGQKRRVGIASALITCPKILFLDEPTSGLDSVASREVISYLREVAKTNHLIVIASIHQPSCSAFALFDNLLLLSAGHTCYYGAVAKVDEFFSRNGLSIPAHCDTAEFLLNLVNVDFIRDGDEARSRLQNIYSLWIESSEAFSIAVQCMENSRGNDRRVHHVGGKSGPNMAFVLLTLLHRSLIKSYRDVVAYGIRIAMYLGLAVMMGTVWVRLPVRQEAIQSFINAIFFGSAFMSFMAVAYVPAFLEDRMTFVKERANGLYGPVSFMLANFLIGLPYLFLISVLFSVIAYWLSNFQPTGAAFMVWVMWLFLDLVAAESLVVLVSSLFPNFVVALALTAFANGLWMSVGGFLVTPRLLNPFYRYLFSYIDYQSYVFKGMMVNEFANRTYSCGPAPCVCMYSTELADQCLIAGQGVLDQYGYTSGNTGKWVGILLGIIAGYRLLGLGILWVRKT